MIARGAGEPEPAVQTPLVADRLISIREIRQLFGLGRTAAYELTHRPGFPTPVRISSRCYRWWATEVTAFAASLGEQAQTSGTSSSRRKMAHRTPSPRDVPALRITGKVRLARSQRKTS